MAAPTTLQEVIGKGVTDACKLNVAVKHQNARSGNVVLNLSGLFIYTLRASPKELRIMRRSDQKRESFSAHTSEPTVAIGHAAGRHHVVATGSATELICWTLSSGDGPMTMKTMCKWEGINVLGASWVKGESDDGPVLVVLHAAGGKTNVSVLSFPAIMQRYVAADVDAAKEVSIGVSDIVALPLGATDCNLLAAGSNGAVKVVAVAKKGGSVVLVADSHHTCCSVSLPGDEGVHAIHCTNDLRLVVVGTSGTIAVFDAQNVGDIVQCVAFKLPVSPEITSGSGPFVTVVTAEHIVTLKVPECTVVALKRQENMQVQSFTVAVDGSGLIASFDQPDAVTFATVFTAAKAVELMAPASVVASPQGSRSGAAQLPFPAPARDPQPVASLRNTSLAGVGSAASPAIASAGEKATQAVDGSLADFRRALAVHQEAVERAASTQRNDIRNLIKLALEAQMKEMLKMKAQAPAPPPQQQQAAQTQVFAPSAVDAKFVEEFMSSLADNVCAGIVEAMRTVAVDAAAGADEGCKKGSKKANTDAMKQRLANAISGASAAFLVTLNDKFNTNQRTFEKNTVSLSAQSQETIRQLHAQVDELRAQLDEISQSGVLEEVRRLRAEVVQLKRSPAAAGPQVSCDTIVAKALAEVQEGNAAGGLEFAASSGLPEAVALVVAGATPELTEVVETLSAEIVADTLALAALGARTQEVAVKVLKFVTYCLDKDDVFTVRSGKARLGLKTFVDQWKTNIGAEREVKADMKAVTLALRN